MELLATFHRDSEARMNRLVSAVETLTAHMQTLTTIALDHDRRIQKLES